jgi:alpha-ketoglutarate-dependent 2,4-dichlorophenoxyacetate dioxygenase
MSIEITPLHPVFAGKVAGIDTAQKLTPAEVAAIEAAMDRYAVLVFRDQRLTDEQQLAFSQAFGELEFTNGTGISKPGEQRLHPAFAGKVLDPVRPCRGDRGRRDRVRRHARRL